MEKLGKVYTIMEFESGGRKSRRKGKKNLGFMAAVGLCCAAVCLAGLSGLISDRRENVNENQIREQEFLAETEDTGDYYEPLGVLSETDWLYEEEQPQDTVDLVFSEDEPQVQEEEPPVTELSTETPPPQEEETVIVAKNLIFDPPMPGSVIKEYSGTELVYCATMSDWRVHRGVDIAGEKGSAVCSAADGTVTHVTEDPLYGITVAVTHSDGSILYYSGLEMVVVKRDDKLKRGDKIGTLGTVPCESNDPAHLHLEMVRNGEYVDPLSMYG